MSLNDLKKSRKCNNNKIDKHYVDEWYHRSVDFLEEGEYRKAFALFRKVLSLNPNDAEVWSYAGEILGRLGKFKESLKIAEKALRLIQMIVLHGITRVKHF
jgi:tetratricopeptide (TPR) repeat protein